MGVIADCQAMFDRACLPYVNCISGISNSIFMVCADVLLMS